MLLDVAISHEVHIHAMMARTTATTFEFSNQFVNARPAEGAKTYTPPKARIGMPSKTPQYIIIVAISDFLHHDVHEPSHAA